MIYSLNFLDFKLLKIANSIAVFSKLIMFEVY